MKEYIEREVLLKKDAFKNSKYCMESWIMGVFVS
jgi:hypothetical protein